MQQYIFARRKWLCQKSADVDNTF